jgi:hypothetical protein
MLYELLTNCIPPDVILKTLTRELLKHLDDTLKHEVIHWAAFYEHRVQVRAVGSIVRWPRDRMLNSVFVVLTDGQQAHFPPGSVRCEVYEFVQGE